MARKNVHGLCELCQKQAKLCKSHYLGRVLHRMSFTGNEPPVVMTPKLVKVSPRQLWAHLLCEDCEQLLNERGEKPFLALCNDGDNNFRLLNLVEVAMPMTQSPSVRVSFGGLLFRDIDGTFSETVVKYSGRAMGIATEALAYYALSVLWKGSVYKWKTFQGQESTADPALSNGRGGIPRWRLRDHHSLHGQRFTRYVLCTIQGQRITVPDVLPIGTRHLVPHHHYRRDARWAKRSLLCSLHGESAVQRGLLGTVPWGRKKHPPNGDHFT